MKKSLQKKFVFLLFVVSSVSATVYCILNSGLSSTHGNIFLLFTYTLPFTAVYLHAAYMLGPKRSLLFLLLASSVGLIFEIIGVNFGTALNTAYSYDMPGPSLFGVPLIIPLFWFVFIYTAYGLVNTALVKNDGKIPSCKNCNKKILYILVLFDALLVTLIDLVMDPVMVKWGQWTWQGNGFYFNIPTENFIGWFLVALIVSGIYRYFEYLYPYNRYAEKSRLNYVPVIGYVMIVSTFAYFSFKLYITSLGLITIFLYLPLLYLIFSTLGKNPKLLFSKQHIFKSK